MTDQTQDRSRDEPGVHRRRLHWKRVLRVLIGVAVLVLIFSEIPLANVLEVLREVQPLPALAAAVLTFIMYAATADRLTRLCQAHGHDWSTWQIFQINLATRFYGLFLPGGNFTGIAIRFYKLSGDRSKYIGTAVALFYDRIAATVALCALGATFWLMERPSDSWQALAAILVVMLVMALALVVLFAKSPGPAVSWLRRSVGRLGGVKLHTLRQAVRESRNLSPGQTAVVYMLSLSAHLLGVLSWYCMCRALNLDLSLVTIGWVRSAMILATMIPISVSGLGLREGAALLLLTTYGVSQEGALAFSLLVFAITTLMIGLVGGLIEGRRMLSRQRGRLT